MRSKTSKGGSASKAELIRERQELRRDRRSEAQRTRMDDALTCVRKRARRQARRTRIVKVYAPKKAQTDILTRLILAVESVFPCPSRTGVVSWTACSVGKRALA